MRLQQGFATGEMGLDRHFAWQQSSGPNVRFGSKADIPACAINVRFTPKSGHQLSALRCPLCAKSRHDAMQQKGFRQNHFDILATVSDTRRQKDRVSLEPSYSRCI